MTNPSEEKTQKIILTPKSSNPQKAQKSPEAQEVEPKDILEELDEIITQVQSVRPRLSIQEGDSKLRSDDLKALLDISQAINSTLVLDDILEIVMRRAIELLKAERGFLMLLDETGQLQFKTAHNIAKESLGKDDFKISMSIANKVAATSESVYTSDAQQDERYSKQRSVLELHLRSIMCVPLKSKDKILGVLYLDNSSEANIFLQSDLYLFELFASQSAIAIENAKLYENLLALKVYNENVVNKTPIGIMVVDKNFKITIANKSSREIFKKIGWKENVSASLTDISIFDLVPQEQRNWWKRICYQVLFTGAAYEEPRTYYSYENQEIVLSLKISPLNNLEDQIIGLIIVIEEVTEKIILEKYLVFSEKMVAKGEMAVSIGHELNNYLTIISNNAELLTVNLKKSDLEKVEQNSKAILESVTTIKRFTDSLMDFSKMETETVPYDIKRLIEDLIFSIKPQKQFESIKLVTKFDPETPLLYLDVGQIQQVFLNLLYNSADAINQKEDPRGVVHISTSYSAGRKELEIKVTDNGIGIPKENLPHIFEPHFTTKEKGHGFGLATCQKILNNHNGKITVESQAGRGTIFTIFLPVDKVKLNKTPLKAK